jgi:hypothetical protein
MAGRGEPLLNGCNNLLIILGGNGCPVHELDGSSDRTVHN